MFAISRMAAYDNILTVRIDVLTADTSDRMTNMVYYDNHTSFIASPIAITICQ